jgi:hypothetical protein
MICKGACGLNLPDDSFYWLPNGKVRRPVCKKCWGEENRKYYAEHKDAMDAYRRGWVKRDRKIKYEKWRRIELRRKYQKYGLTEGWYDEQLVRQNGVCAICGKPETRLHNMTKTLMPLSVDHNHITQRVRGLLCWSCNLTLHRVEDSGWLKQSLDYLQKYSKETHQ